MDYELTMHELQVILEKYYHEKYPETVGLYPTMDICTDLTDGKTFVAINFSSYN